jgi:hypothetical protein
VSDDDIGIVWLVDGRDASFDEYIASLRRLPIGLPPRPVAALAALHAAVGPALDGLDPEAVLRERAEERR